MYLQKVISRKKFIKKISFLLASWRSMTKIAGSWSKSGSGSGSISQRHGSADPDPHQNVMDPEHWLQYFLLTMLMPSSFYYVVPVFFNNALFTASQILCRRMLGLNTGRLQSYIDSRTLSPLGYLSCKTKIWNLSYINYRTLDQQVSVPVLTLVHWPVRSNSGQAITCRWGQSAPLGQ
jgi:hypothetical protein